MDPASDQPQRSTQTHRENAKPVGSRSQASRTARPSSKATDDSKDSSWQAGLDWYDDIVGDEGHYYHRQVILPRLLPLLNLPRKGSCLLADLGCGQGILERILPESVTYWGVDLSPGLVERASQRAAHPDRCHFVHGDASQSSPLPQHCFDRVVVMLAMQNMESPGGCLQQIARLLKPDGFAVIILNHPAFRIPTQSDWLINREKGVRSRTVDRYLSPMKIPLKLHPSQGQDSAVAWSFHLPLSRWSELAQQAGLGIVRIEEWCSDKKSEGPMAAIEDRSRREIPLFAALVLRRWS